MLQVFGRNRKSRIFVIRELFQNRFSYRLYTMVFLRRNLLCDRLGAGIWFHRGSGSIDQPLPHSLYLWYAVSVQ